MSEPGSLPPRPSLRRLRDDAKSRRKAGEFPSIALAQLAVAREYGFRSWPRLKFHVEAVTLDASERAAALIESAMSADLRRARALLDAGTPIDAPGQHGLTPPSGRRPRRGAAVATLLRERGADQASVTDEDRAIGMYMSGGDPTAPGTVASSALDEMLMLSIQGGHLEAMRRLHAAGARIDGDPELTRMLLRGGRRPDRRSARAPRQRGPLPRVRVRRPDLRDARDRCRRPAGLRRLQPRAGAQLPEPRDDRDVLHARREGVGRAPSPGGLAPAAAEDGRRAARHRCAGRRAGRARPHAPPGRRPLG